MPRYALTIAYDGTDFHGWQKQRSPEDAAIPEGGTPGESSTPRVRTVQAVVERAVREVMREPVELLGASRTDAGVHALGQVAAFTRHDIDRGPPEDRFDLALNARLPEDVQVMQVRRAPDDFDPITDCASKAYRYTLHTGRHRPLWARRWVHHLHEPLRVDAMADAAASFVGEHDFAAFTNAGHGRLTTVRTVLSCAVTPLDDGFIAIDVSGTGFLFRMVRIIAGTLVEVGKGKRTATDIGEALTTGDRRRAGPTLPPTGLRLEWIRYPEGRLTPCGP